MPDSPYTKRQKLSDRRLQRQALRPFWDALARRSTRQVNIACITDSNGEGAKAIGSPSTMAQKVDAIQLRWPNRLQAKLNAAYPTAGVTDNAGYICANYYVLGNAASPQALQVFTQTGGSTNASYLYGLGRRHRTLSASGHALAITVSSTSFDVLFTAGVGRGIVSLTIDGGAPSSIDMANPYAWSGKWANSGPLSPGSHDIVIAWQSGGAVDIEGIKVYNGDEGKGIHVWEGGHGGVKTDFYNGGFWLTIPGGRGVFYNIQPDLTIIELGTNDLLFNTGSDFPSSAVTGHIQTLITQVRTAAPSTAILIAIPHQVGGSYVEPWANYVNALWRVALADPAVAIVDMTELMGIAATSRGLFDVDLIHANQYGHELAASHLFSAITP